MNEKPILMSALMVRAILYGRKVQTRRACKFTEGGHLKGVGTHKRWHPADPNAVQASPYGQPGDRLWVKETLCVAESPEGEKCYAYRADNWTEAPSVDGKWMPSIFCRRVASRITLEITAVRVERLNDISEADAKAEGSPAPTGRRGCYPAPWATAKAGPCNYRESYRKLWESINGIGSWAANPWVWVITFRRMKP